MLVNLYWLVEMHYGQCSSTVSCRCFQMYKHSVTCVSQRLRKALYFSDLLSQWIRKGECYPKPHSSIKYKEALLALKLTWEIQYYLYLYILQGHFNIGQVCYVFLKKTKAPKQQLQQQNTPPVCIKAITHQLCARALLYSKFSEQEYK